MNEETQKVLIIDDDSFFSEMIANKLRTEKMECVYAPTATVGLTLLETLQPHCILLDVAMPDMNGLDVLKKIKGDPRTTGIPVIMFSNDADDEHVKESKARGAVVFLQKVEVSPGEVVDAILAATKPQ